MDMVVLRSLLTLVAFLVFLGIVAWAWSARRKPDFDEAARLPFDGEDDELSKVRRTQK